MASINPLPSDHQHQPRDTLSNGYMLANRVRLLLNEDHTFWLTGRCSGLRAYGFNLCDCIVDLVQRSAAADPSEFDTYVEIVGYLALDLEDLLYELLMA
jgi:hypothetical protein